MARRRNLNPATLVVGLLFAGVVAYVLLVPWVQQQLASPISKPVLLPPLSPLEWIRERALDAFATLWLFFFGAVFGSFINVVAFRMPRGESVVWRPSRCPFCETPIRPQDNLPVLGWLALRGRCRGCRLPISARYPTVELIAGLLIVGLALVELVGGAANLPVRSPLPLGGYAFVVFDPQWDVLATFAYHGALLLLLLTWSLMALDGFSPPLRFLSFAFAIAWLSPLALPTVQPVPWLLPLPESWPAWTRPALTSAAGTGMGVFLGLVLASVGNSAQHAGGRFAAAFALLGSTLGWQAVVSAAVFYLPVAAFCHALATPRRDWRIAWLLAAAFVQIVSWRGLSQIVAWPGPHTSPWLMLAALGLLIAVGLVLRLSEPAGPTAADHFAPSDNRLTMSPSEGEQAPERDADRGQPPQKSVADAEKPN